MQLQSRSRILKRRYYSTGHEIIIIIYPNRCACTGTVYLNGDISSDFKVDSVACKATVVI